MAFEKVQSYKPIFDTTVRTVKDKAQTVGNFAYGNWSDDFGTTLANDFAKDVGMVPNGAKFSDIFQKKTWQTARENFGKIGNITESSLYNDPITTIQKAYSSANITVAEKEAAKAAEKQAAKLAEQVAKEAATPGFFGNAIQWTGKQLNRVAKPATKLLSKIPGVTPACNAIGKVGQKIKLPGFANILMTVGEIPKVFEAFSKGGFKEGSKQIVRSAGDLTISCASFAVGSAAGASTAGVIGQMLCPIPGLGFVLGAVGGMACSYVAGKMTKPVIDGVMGKSFEERQENAKIKISKNHVQKINNPQVAKKSQPLAAQTYGLTPQEMAYLRTNLGQPPKSPLTDILTPDEMSYLGSNLIPNQQKIYG